MGNKINPEGLTWDEWARAAKLPRPPLEIVLPFPQYEAWKRGEDPTEYASSFDEDESDCEGHPSGSNGPGGQTVYCDGSCNDGRLRFDPDRERFGSD